MTREQQWFQTLRSIKNNVIIYVFNEKFALLKTIFHVNAKKHQQLMQQAKNSVWHIKSMPFEAKSWYMYCRTAWQGLPYIVLHVSSGAIQPAELSGFKFHTTVVLK